MENTSDSFMPRPLLFCLKSERSVCYSVPDNTLTLKVNAVFPYRGISKVYTHEVTVRDTSGGEIQYVANRIVEPMKDQDIAWHTALKSKFISH